MKRRTIALSGALLAATLLATEAGAANCAGDRKLYPKDWKSVAGETPLFTCAGRYVRLQVFLTRRGETTLMLTVVDDSRVYRAIADVREADRIEQQTGLYILNSEKTCFIRGNYASPAVLSFSDRSMSNAFNFLFAADRLDAFDGCEAAR
jgi:hypothetical protein